MTPLFERFKGFIIGILTAVSISSLIAYAATSIQGLNIFTSGTVISSAAINQNFERLAGVIQYQATSGPAAVTLTQSDLISVSPCNSGSPCRREKLPLTNVVIDDSTMFFTKTDTDTFYTNAGTGNYNYYKIATDGWYEIILKTNGITYSSISSLICGGGGPSVCAAQVNLNFSVLLSNTDGSGNTLPSTDYVVSNYVGLRFEDRNSNSDLSDEINLNSNAIRGESKKIFLKAGTVVFVHYMLDYYDYGTTMNFTVNIPANAIELTIVKI